MKLVQTAFIYYHPKRWIDKIENLYSISTHSQIKDTNRQKSSQCIIKIKNEKRNLLSKYYLRITKRMESTNLAAMLSNIS